MFLDGATIPQVMFPDNFIPTSEKGREWHLQYAQAAYGQNFANQYMLGRYDQWRLNRMFAQGRQPVQRYVQILCGDGGKQNNQDTGNKHTAKDANDTNFMNINWRIVSVMPKIRDSVINYVNKIKFRAEFNSMNPVDIDEKRDKKNAMWAEKQLQADLDELEQLGNFKFNDRQDTSWIPDDYEEFEALAHAKTKLKAEIAAELGCAQVFNDNEWKITERRIDEDNFDLAFSAVECRTNKFTGKIDVNYIDPQFLIMPTFSGKVGEDIWIIGVVEQISLYQLYQEAGDQYTPEEYKLIAETYRSKFNNVWNINFDWYGTVSNQYAAWKSFKVSRQKTYWYDADVKKWTSTQKGDGEPMYRWRDFNKPPKNTEYNTPDGERIKKRSGELQGQVVRECSWIIGTSYIHNWGKLRDVSRDQMDKRQSMLPIKVYRIADQSRVERAIPFIDNVCLTWYRLQDRVARGIPPGIRINLDAFEKLIIDQKEWTTAKLLEMATQSGIFFYRTTDTMIPDNGGQALNPIEPHEGSGYAIFPEYINLIDNSIQKIRDVTGIGDIMDTAMPDAKTPVGIAKMSYTTIINSISELVFSREYLFEKTSLDIANKLQLKTLDGDIDMYSTQLGEIIKIPQQLSVSQLGIKVVAVPTDQGREEMKLMLQTALQTTGVPLDFDDLYYINNTIDTCDSLKWAERLISLRINKRREQLQKEKMQAIQVQGQDARMLEQQKHENAKQLIDYDLQSKMQYEQFMTGQIITRDKASSENRIEQTAVRSGLKNQETTHKAVTETLVPKE